MKKKSPAEHRRELARNIAAIFVNPETPRTLRNYLGEGMTEVFNEIGGARCDESEEYTLAVLNEHAKAQKGGAS